MTTYSEQDLQDTWQRAYQRGFNAGVRTGQEECDGDYYAGYAQAEMDVQKGADHVADQLATLTAIEEMLARLGLDAQEFLALRWEEQERLSRFVSSMKYQVGR
jgi:hypothetical protein